MSSTWSLTNASSSGPCRRRHASRRTDRQTNRTARLPRGVAGPIQFAGSGSVFGPLFVFLPVVFEARASPLEPLQTAPGVPDGAPDPDAMVFHPVLAPRRPAVNVAVPVGNDVDPAAALFQDADGVLREELPERLDDLGRL